MSRWKQHCLEVLPQPEFIGRQNRRVHGTSVQASWSATLASATFCSPTWCFQLAQPCSMVLVNALRKMLTGKQMAGHEDNDEGWRTHLTCFAISEESQDTCRDGWHWVYVSLKTTRASDAWCHQEHSTEHDQQGHVISSTMIVDMQELRGGSFRLRNMTRTP